MSHPPSSPSPHAAAPRGPGRAAGAAQYGPAQTAHGPGPYGQAAPAPKGRKGPLILLLAGVALCALAGITIVVLAVSATRTVDELRPIVANVANGASAVRLDAGEVYGLYGNGSSDCGVTGADGTELEVTRPSSSIAVNGRQLFGVVEPASSGDHTITCSTLLVGADVYFGPLVGAQDIGRAVFGVFAAVGILVLGIPLTIGGGIWLVVRNSRNKRARQAQATAPTAGPGF